MRQRPRFWNLACGSTLLYCLGFWWTVAAERPLAAPAAPQDVPARAPASQGPDQMKQKSDGCLSCHTYAGENDSPTMHVGNAAVGCTDCHGGRAEVKRPAGGGDRDRAFDRATREAHDVEPALDIWRNSSANPAGVWHLTLNEREKFIQFVNPGDPRVAEKSCGGSACHGAVVAAVSKSMMRHGGMLWGAALYNNGSYPLKDTAFGEFYTADGQPARANTLPVPQTGETARSGVLPSLQPLFPFQVTQPGNILRVFERGGRRPLEVGVPDPDEEPGRPKNRLSNRGLGTLNRTDPVFIGLQKTRLFDPTLNFIGPNDVAGDFRSSGCTACHVTYANDTSKVHSGADAAAGNLGMSQTSDPMIPKNQPGHPIRHKMTRSAPTSQCMTCHMHPGTNMLTTYQGLTWWDNETDGDKMYPAKSRHLSAAERASIEKRNPEGSALRGLWSDPAFLRSTGTQAFNATLKHTQFADFNGHGWLFRAVFKRDAKGRLIDANGQLVPDTSSSALRTAFEYTDLRAASERPASLAERATERAGKPVHLKDIHLERGMQCADCHFSRDSHGDGKLYGEPRAAIEIACADCHGTTRERATLRTSGPGAPRGGTDLRAPTMRAAAGGARFVIRGSRVIQNSATTPGQSWDIPQVIDVITPGNPRYNERARLAKTIQRGNQRWGDAQSPDLAHTDEKMTCAGCHTSWVTSCFGCHLSQTANQKKDVLHNDLTTTKNWTSYNFQVLRDDVFMLGKDGTVAGGRISPVRSSSAVVVSSQDANRQWIYAQQQTVSAEGYAGQAFNTHVPHTVRGRETKTCTDCHVSANGDNNAKMAQLLLLGTNFVNFMGRFVFVATGRGGVDAVAVTEMDEPQAVIGSDLHRIAYPEQYAEHQQSGQTLTTSIHHGSANALGVQARGEYLYVADGDGGLRVLDIAQLHNKGFSEKIVSAPVSPLGQRTRVGTRFAAAVAAPSTLAVDPARTRQPVNEEQPIHPMYAYLYVADRDEGLVVTTAAPLLDGNPTNNFLKRVVAFNPEGRLRGAVSLALAGHHAYVLCDRGLVVVDLDRPDAPRIVGEIAAPALNKPTGIAIQFRYAFVTDADGMKVINITTPAQPRLVPGAVITLSQARAVYVARTYAYVAAGPQGLAIIDIERPERPVVNQMFNAGGAMNDTNDVKIAMTNASVFAYVADGRNGLRVLQMVSANATPGAFGFSPTPTPALIATFKTHEPALSISKGLDWDRAVDESGHQVAVFGRRGSRPLNLVEMQRMYLKNDAVWTVQDGPPGPATSSGPPALFPEDWRPAASHSRRSPLVSRANEGGRR